MQLFEEARVLSLKPAHVAVHEPQCLLGVRLLLHRDLQDLLLVLLQLLPLLAQACEDRFWTEISPPFLLP